MRQKTWTRISRPRVPLPFCALFVSSLLSNVRGDSLVSCHQAATAFVANLARERPHRWSNTFVEELAIPIYTPDGVHQSDLFRVTRNGAEGFIEVLAEPSCQVIRLALTPHPLSCAEEVYLQRGIATSSLAVDLQTGKTRLVRQDIGYFLASAEGTIIADLEVVRRQALPGYYRTRDYLAERRHVAGNGFLDAYEDLIYEMAQQAAANILELEYAQHRKWLIALGVDKSLPGIFGGGVTFFLDAADLVALTPEGGEDWLTAYLDFQGSLLSISIWDVVELFTGGTIPFTPVFGIVRQDPSPFLRGNEDPARDLGCDFLTGSFFGQAWTTFGHSGTGFHLGEAILLDVSFSVVACTAPLIQGEIRRSTFLAIADAALNTALAGGQVQPGELHDMQLSIMQNSLRRDGNNWTFLSQVRSKTPNDGSHRLDDGSPVGPLTEPQDSYYHFVFNVPANSSQFSVETWGGNGDADIYLKRGYQPTTSSFDNRAASDDNSEAIVLEQPDAGAVFMMVHAYRAYNGLYIKASTVSPPSILSHRAGSGRETNIYVLFSEDMDLTTFADTSVIVAGSSSGVHTSTFGFDRSSSELTIDPIVAFTHGERVNVAIGTGVRDRGGSALASPKTSVSPCTS